jgi:flagellar protein FlgJ
MAVANDPRAFAREVQRAGYATDPGYAYALIGLMERYDLYRFDRR